MCKNGEFRALGVAPVYSEIPFFFATDCCRNFRSYVVGPVRCSNSNLSQVKPTNSARINFPISSPIVIQFLEWIYELSS